MSIYPEIINRIIETETKCLISNDSNQDEPIQPNTRVIFGISTVICPEVHKWEMLYNATRSLPHDQSTVYILLFYSFCKMGMLVSTDMKTICQTKFRIIDKLLTSDFVKEPIIYNNILLILQRAQRIYYAFSALARCYRYKRTTVQINTDLYMNDIITTKPTTFVLLDHDKLYYFALNDLSKIILDSLTYSYMFFPEPKVCKNPYNNMPFTKSALYNMYFQMKSVFCVVPRLIQAFFESDFNVFLFKKRNEPVLREHIIREYIAKTEPIRMRLEILKMVRQYDPDGVLDIHPLFPPESLLRGLKHLYVIYLYRNHTMDGQMCENYDNELKYGMVKFIKNNPRFGRIVISASSKYIPVKHPNRANNATTTLTNTNMSESSSSVIGLPPQALTELFTGAQAESSALTVNELSGKYNVSRFVDTVVHNRDPELLRDFLENHQYNENAYNRYVYSGSITVTDESDTSSQNDSTSDEYEPANRNTTTNDDSDNDIDEDEYVLRIHEPSVDELVAVDMLAQIQNMSPLHLQSVVALFPDPQAAYYTPEPHRPFIFGNESTAAPPQIPPDSHPTLNDEHNIDNVDNDDQSTTTDEYVGMRNIYEYVIEGDDLSIATSIDEDDDIYADDGYDSVS